MQLAIKHRNPSHEPSTNGSIKRLKRYTVLSQLAAGRRAEILLGLAEDADTLDKLVVIKAFSPELLGTGLAELGNELSLASELQHENIARTLSIGFEARRHFIVSEYLEGTTLRALLGWSRSVGQSLPSAAVVRILRAMLDALEHAAHCGASAEARELIKQPIATDDVFITYDGSVKLLGFKAAHRQAPELRAVPHAAAPDDAWSASGGASGAQNAIDCLLSGQLTPELAQLLARLASPATAPPEDWVYQVRDALDRWLSEELGGDGRAELAAIMCRVWPEARAREAAELQAAFEKHRARKATTSRHLEQKGDDAPVSRYRAQRSVASSPEPEPGPSNPPAVMLAAQGVKAPGGARSASPSSASRRYTWAILAVLACSSAIYWATTGDAPVPSPPPVAPPPRAALSQTQAPLASLKRDPVDRPPVTRPSVPDRVEGMLNDERAAVQARPARADLSGASVRRTTRAAAPPGYLTLDTTPWSNVSLGGVSLGQTPLVGVVMQAGDHLLELVNSELGITSRYVVNITSGVTTVRRVGLEQPRSREREGAP